MSTAHEHDPRAVEALAVEVEWAGWPNCGREPGCQPMLASRRIACMILSREAALVKAIEDAVDELGTGYTRSRLQQALRAHRASTQPSEPTWDEQALSFLRVISEHGTLGGWSAMATALVAARERSRDGGK